MVAITVNQKVFEILKQAYIEKFGGSPKFLIAELNRVYQDKDNSTKMSFLTKLYVISSITLNQQRCRRRTLTFYAECYGIR
jgi:hypothetical protein